MAQLDLFTNDRRILRAARHLINVIVATVEDATARAEAISLVRQATGKSLMHSAPITAEPAAETEATTTVADDDTGEPAQEI